MDVAVNRYYQYCLERGNAAPEIYVIRDGQKLDYTEAGGTIPDKA